MHCRASRSMQKTILGIWVLRVAMPILVGLDVTEAIADRNEDGSLPETSLLHLSSGSRLIDAGIDCGYPYKGTAPDLGCYESSFSSGVTAEEKEACDVRIVVDHSSVSVLDAEKVSVCNCTAYRGSVLPMCMEIVFSTASVSTGRYIVRWSVQQDKLLRQQKVLVN